MGRVTVTEVRDQISDTLNRVAYKGERLVVRRHGKDVAAIVPVEDLELLRELEDKRDIELAKKALAESKERIPYDKIRKQLGLR